MRAVFIRRFGGGEVLELGEIAQANPGPTEVLVRVSAAGLNPIDYKMRQGKLRFLMPTKWPLVLGLDLAGTITAIGEEVRRFKIGDEVFACLDYRRGGALAEYAVIQEDLLAFKPSILTDVDAAAVPLAALTAWQALIGHGHLRAGERVLVHAGSGGVGSLAVQLAKHLGARVAATASTRNLELVQQLGADVVIDYRRQDFAALIQDYDLVLDTVGGEVRNRSFPCLKRLGSMISIAGTPTGDAARGLGLPKPIAWGMDVLNYKTRRLARRHGVHFEYMFMLPNAQQLTQIAELLEAQAIRPLVDKVFKLSEAREAFAYLEAGHATGKVVVEIA
jgi:alcohol dehydrogenase